MAKITTIQEFEQFLRQNQLLEKYHLAEIGVFGSFARGEVANDIDVLVGEMNDYRQLIPFKAELEQLLNKKIDVVIE